jgi:lipoprotein-releasing system permease protein
MIDLAVHYLLARKKQTVLMLLGVFFGTASFITLSALLLGFKDFLVNQLVNNSASIHIGPAAGARFVQDPKAWYARLDADPRVQAYSPQFIEPVIFSAGGTGAPGLVVGCDPRRQTRVTTIGGYVVEGSFQDLGPGGARIALGEELRKSLGVGLSQDVMVSPASGPPQAFKVVAVFKTGIQQGDTMAYIPLGAAQTLARAGGQVNGIAVKLADYSAAAGIADAWSKRGPEKAESWDQENANFVQTFKAEDMVRFLSIGAVLLVAGFGIYNVLNMTVVQKRKDIAILRSMGYSFGDILGLFFSQGLLLGFSGGVLGLLGAYGACLYLRTVSFGGNPMGSGTGHLAVSLNPAIFAQALFLALFATSLASILPAYAAAKLTPIEIIRAGAE